LKEYFIAGQTANLWFHRELFKSKKWVL